MRREIFLSLFCCHVSTLRGCLSSRLEKALMKHRICSVFRVWTLQPPAPLSSLPSLFFSLCFQVSVLNLCIVLITLVYYYYYSFWFPNPPKFGQWGSFRTASVLFSSLFPSIFEHLLALAQDVPCFQLPRCGTSISKGILFPNPEEWHLV
jgi:hypothetical protein